MGARDPGLKSSLGGVSSGRRPHPLRLVLCTFAAVSSSWRGVRVLRAGEFAYRRPLVCVRRAVAIHRTCHLVRGGAPFHANRVISHPGKLGWD